MSILGYSASYFLPEYWSNTPFYGEKIIPLLDYILSSDFSQADKLANAFYLIENKYKDTANLPISAIEDIIDESGYSYVRNLLGRDEEGLRLLVYLLVLIHQLKGTKLGIEVVLNLLRRDNTKLVQSIIGNLNISPAREVSNFSASNYIIYSGFSPNQDSFELTFEIRTPSQFTAEQCVASCPLYGFYLGITKEGNITLSLGSSRETWDIANGELSTLVLQPNTSYFVVLSFDGSTYAVKVSTDGKKYRDYLVFESTETINVNKGSIYLGVDNSSGTTQNPFLGSINLAPFAADVKGIEITEWFEKFPVGEEDTFEIKAELDLSVLSQSFFENFSTFVSKYVYPSLAAFEAKVTLRSNLTFLPYVRQRITYVAEGDLRDMWGYRVRKIASDPSDMLNFTVNSGHGWQFEFEVVPED